MSKNDFDRLFDQLETLSVGFGPFMRDFQLSMSTSTNYPPHNIVNNSDKEFILELAVAGFKRSQISASLHNGILTIKGDKSQSVADDNKYQHHGIANRAFEKIFRIAEFYELVDANLEDGILSITFRKNVPEEAKPKLIEIK